jgi:hypothetical protein
MKLTSSLFGAYLKCPTKCFLWSRGETGTEETYGHWVRTQDEFYRREALRCAKMESPESEVLINPIGAERLKKSNWRWALDFAAETKHGLFSVQALTHLSLLGGSTTRVGKDGLATVRNFTVACYALLIS